MKTHRFLKKTSRLLLIIMILSFCLSQGYAETAGTTKFVIHDDANMIYRDTTCYTCQNQNVDSYSDPAGRYTGGKIFPSDKVSILGVSEGFFNVQYPISIGTRNAYCKISDIISNPGATQRITIDKDTTVYKKSDMAETFGTVYSTDYIVLLTNNNDGKIQIQYNVSSGYKIGWIYASETGVSTNNPVSTNPVSTNTSNSKIYCYTWGNEDVNTYETLISNEVYGEIFPNDCCTILGSAEAYFLVSYPIDDGTKFKTAYCPKSCIIKDMLQSPVSIKLNKNKDVYRKPDMAVVFGTSYIEDEVLQLSPVYDNKVQIQYNVSGGYKIGWITTDGVQNISYPVTNTTVSPTKAPEPILPTATPTADPSVKGNRLYYGDMNKDGRITTSDLVYVERYINGDDSIDKYAADVNLDNSVNSTDLAYMSRFILGTIPSLPVLAEKNYPNATKLEYGYSGNNRKLYEYVIKGDQVTEANKKIAVLVFEQHGFEDEWARDGYELVKIANYVLNNLKPSDLGEWEVHIIPSANPDGLIDGNTQNGPGRCTVVGGIDMNRSFPCKKWEANYKDRNNTGPNVLGAIESKSLYMLLDNIKNNTKANRYILLDFHGWLDFVQGSESLSKYFEVQFSSKNKYYTFDSGLLITTANEVFGMEAALVEYPKPTTGKDIVTGQYAEKTLKGLKNLFANNLFKY